MHTFTDLRENVFRMMYERSIKQGKVNRNNVIYRARDVFGNNFDNFKKYLDLEKKDAESLGFREENISKPLFGVYLLYLKQKEKAWDYENKKVKEDIEKRAGDYVKEIIGESRFGKSEISDGEGPNMVVYNEEDGRNGLTKGYSFGMSEIMMYDEKRSDYDGDLKGFVSGMEAWQWMLIKEGEKLINRTEVKFDSEERKGDIKIDLESFKEHEKKGSLAFDCAEEEYQINKKDNLESIGCMKIENYRDLAQKDGGYKLKYAESAGRGKGDYADVYQKLYLEKDGRPEYGMRVLFPKEDKVFLFNGNFSKKEFGVFLKQYKANIENINDNDNQKTGKIKR